MMRNADARMVRSRPVYLNTTKTPKLRKDTQRHTKTRKDTQRHTKTRKNMQRRAKKRKYGENPHCAKTVKYSVKVPKRHQIGIQIPFR